MGKIIFKIGLSVGLAGCDREDEFEISKEEWDEMDEEEQQIYIHDLKMEFIHSNIEMV